MQDKEMTSTDSVKVEGAAVSEVKVEQGGELKQPSPPPQGPTALCVGAGQATGIEGAGQSPEGQRHASGNSQGSGGQQGKRAGGNRRWEGGMRMGDDIVTLFPRRKAGQTRPGGGRGPVVLTLELLQQFYGMPLHVAAKQLVDSSHSIPDPFSPRPPLHLLPRVSPIRPKRASPLPAARPTPPRRATRRFPCTICPTLTAPPSKACPTLLQALFAKPRAFATCFKQ